MKSIEKLSAKECTAALEEALTRLRDVNARLAEIRPSPHETRFAAGRPEMPNYGPTPIGAPAFDPLAGAGPAYKAAVLEGTPGQLVALEEERLELEAEQRQLSHRIHVLKERRKVAEQEEAKRAAPAKARKLLDALPGVLDRVDTARLELAAALEERDATLRELDAARALTEGEPYFSPELLRRVWASDPRGQPISAHVLRGGLSTRPNGIKVTVPSVGSGPMVRPEYRNDCASKLEPPAPGLLDRARGRRSDTEVTREWAEARARELGAALSE